MTEAQAADETLAQREHRLDLHRDFKLAGCLDCWPAGDWPTVEAQPERTLVETPRPRGRASSTKSLGEAFAALRLKLPVRGEPDPEPEPSCARCRDYRWVRVDLPVGHPDFGRLVLCPDCRSLLIQERLEKLWGLLPSEFRDWTFETYLDFTSLHFPEYSARHVRLVDTLRSWLQTTHWLYLYSGGEAGSPGGAGRGKTGLAIALLKLLIEQGQTGIFTSTADLLQTLRASYADHSAYVDAGRREELGLKTVDVLVLDEIGAERGNDWSIRDVLGPLIAYRHANGLRTILTSNLDFEALSDHLGHTRIPSRIRERTDAGQWMLDLSELPDLRRVRKMAF